MHSMLNAPNIQKITTWLEPHWNNQQINQRFNKKNMLIVAGVITIISIATMMSIDAYTHYQNKKIEKFDCHIGEKIGGIVYNVDYYKKAAEKFRSLATDQYCLAKIFKTDDKKLSEARNWYKKSIDKGLTFAQKKLCQPSMFEIKFTLGDLYSEFRSICCLEYASFHNNDGCPWYKSRGQ